MTRHLLAPFHGLQEERIRAQSLDLQISGYRSQEVRHYTLYDGHHGALLSQREELSVVGWLDVLHRGDVKRRIEAVSLPHSLLSLRGSVFSLWRRSPAQLLAHFTELDAPLHHEDQKVIEEVRQF